MMGVPAANDADPSVLIAMLAPLMFGFMFGDVAQGAIVALGGCVLGRRMPALRLLLPGGLVAMAFGFAFGSVFAREDLIPALWLRPLEQPLPVLGAALGFGVAVLALGLALDGLQAYWRGQLRHWLLCDAGLLLAYLGLVATALDVRALWAVPLGIGLSLGGSALAHPEARIAAFGRAAGESVERLLQLGVNTVSFVRVGAFALAHAGLCSAVVGMADRGGCGLLARADPGQCRDHRARRPGRQHPDDAPGAVRVLHPFPDGTRPPVRAANAAAGIASRRHAMTVRTHWILALATLTVTTVIVATLTLLAAWPALAAEAAPAAAAAATPRCCAGATPRPRWRPDSPPSAPAMPWPR